jgi:hypothetical protein
MAHRNYHEISGNSPAECGAELGRCFGSIIRDYVEAAREEADDWKELTREAEALLACTNRAFPAYVEELQAYASAARVPLLDLWTMSIEDELGDDDVEKCTTVVTNGGRLISHNEDWDADAVADICVLKKRCGDVTTLELYYYGCPLGGSALSICSNGFVQAINSLSHSDGQVGVPKLVIGRRLSELRNIDKELGSVLAVPRSSGFAHNLVHRSGQVTSVECTATKQVVTRPALPFVHTNHMLDAKLEKLAGPADGKSTFRRYDTACTLADAAMDTPALVRLSGDETSGKTNSIFNRNTIARAIVDLDRRVADIWLRREAQKQWVSYPVDFLFGSEALTS